jgi:hypothetical protein
MKDKIKAEPSNYHYIGKKTIISVARKPKDKTG